MRKLLLVPFAASAALLAAAPVAGSATSVTVGDNYFAKPSGVPSLTVSKGTTVKWVWRGKSLHNVNVTKGPVKFRSSAKKSGTYSKTLKRRGTYTIVCTIHGESDQSMKLVVK